MGNRESFRFYRGSKIVTLKDREIPCLVRGLIYKGDDIVLHADAKRGKSIVLQQLACSVTTKGYFLDEFEVYRPLNVLYISTEGRDEDLANRLWRISQHVKTDFNKLFFICSNTFFVGEEDTDIKMRKIIKMLKEEGFCPDIIIIDPLYRAINKSVTDDTAIQKYARTLRQWSELSNDAVTITCHHMRKEKQNYKGEVFDRTDFDICGSVFIGAGADSIFRLERHDTYKGDLVLCCDTQRSGKVEPNTRIRLIQDPLHFEYISIHDEEETRIINTISKTKEGYVYNDALRDELGITKTKYFAIMNRLERIKKIWRNNERPVKVYINNNHKHGLEEPILPLSP